MVSVAAASSRSSTTVASTGVSFFRYFALWAGTARVTRDNETLLVQENESVYIPLGTVHRLENPGKVMLEVIEVQSGSYLGEDDIVRYEDTYGRVIPVNRPQQG